MEIHHIIKYGNQIWQKDGLFTKCPGISRKQFELDQFLEHFARINLKRMMDRGK